MHGAGRSLVVIDGTGRRCARVQQRDVEPVELDALRRDRELPVVDGERPRKYIDLQGDVSGLDRRIELQIRERADRARKARHVDGRATRHLADRTEFLGHTRQRREPCADLVEREIGAARGTPDQGGGAQGHHAGHLRDRAAPHTAAQATRFQAITTVAQRAARNLDWKREAPEPCSRTHAAGIQAQGESALRHAHVGVSAHRSFDVLDRCQLRARVGDGEHATRFRQHSGEIGFEGAFTVVEAHLGKQRDGELRVGEMHTSRLRIEPGGAQCSAIERQCG